MESITACGIDLRQRQNASDLILLLKAATVSHRRARRLDVIYLSISTVVAATGLVATFGAPLAVPAAMLGGVWAVAYSAGISSWTQRELRRAATLQEMFDVRLFGLPWNAVAAGEPVGGPEVSWLAKRHGSGAAPRDYYDVPALPRPYDVITCQMYNLAWGARVRRRYARALVVAIAVWTVAGVVVGAAAGLTVVDTALRWYVPSIGALLMAWDVVRTQHDVAAERERVLGLLWSWVRTVPAGDLAVPIRAVQDAILYTRVRSVRVPNWFYASYRDLDRGDFRALAAELAAEVRAAPAARPAAG